MVPAGGFTRLRSVAACIVAAAALCAVAPGSAVAATAKTKKNTFDGQCTNVPVTGHWPNPLTFAPQTGDFIAIADGGSCSGTLNGKQVQDVPMTGKLVMNGLQSCGEAVLHGSLYITVAGKPFYFSVTDERRAGRDAVIVAQADGSGKLLMHAVGDVSFVRHDDPIVQQNPVLAPFGGTMGGQDFMEACSGSGISELPITVDRAIATDGISSPASERGFWSHRGRRR